MQLIFCRFLMFVKCLYEITTLFTRTSKGKYNGNEVQLFAVPRLLKYSLLTSNQIFLFVWIHNQNTLCLRSVVQMYVFDYVLL